ncbi:MAG TPA: alpha-2-macroglobulin family protein [Pyrinomonadaceae bacterium]|nr:alpha-2-macroglobulin family protein [Pyrinomonadaceae bacterium]
MKTIILSISVFTFLLFNAVAQQADYPQLRSEAEAQYAQGSYARANEIYARVDKTKLSPVDVRWVEFRLADTSWRAQSATQTSDNTPFEQAQKQLEELIRAADKEADRDLVWAEAHESLGDLFWTRRDQMNWSAAWPHYQQALDWWAGQRDLDRARDRYLKMVFKAAQPPANTNYYYAYYRGYIPLDVLENALKISVSENDKSHLNFLIAMSMPYVGDWEARQRVPDQFEDALKAGKQADWYDDALFHYAEWMNSYGIPRQLDNGQWQQQPDYVKALELYRRLTREFVKGETAYYDQAQQRIKEISEPSLGLGVSNIFLPGSEIQFGLIARNVQRVDFALYKIDMPREVRFINAADEDQGEGDAGPWIQKISIAGRAPVKSWFKDIHNTEDHKPYNEQIHLDAKLRVGAYLLEAKSGSQSARELVLVSDASLVLKSSTSQGLVFFADAVTGAPIANANIALWESYYQNNTWHWRRTRQTTDADGLARFTLTSIPESRNLFAFGASSDRQAFASSYSYVRTQNEAWRIYAFTDRPAYRPKETLQWKFIARRSNNGAYSTPANEVIEYQIDDPRGTKVIEGRVTLNTFGSAWGSLELGEQLPLGEYNIQFWEQGRSRYIGNAKLFRLEEYKLPEFKVQVKTPEENGKKKAFRLGEKVEVDIQADYYFGGPVSNASVEVVVYQNPFYQYWFPQREYVWYYDDFENQRRNYYGGQGTIIKRETIKTDATGKARLTFDTPRENYNQDFEFRIEARVVDSSRREIIASDRVRVTRRRYYVYPRPEQNIYRPKDKVTVDIKALDANEQPVQTVGTVKVTRDYWWEIWIDPRGREVQGEELRQLQQKSNVFPPLVAAGQQPWRLKFRGYQHDDILTQSVKTDSDGVAQFNFTPEREGYYRVAWQSSQGGAAVRDRFLPPVKAEAYVFVATNATTDLGYRHSGVEIVTDKDTFRVGQTAPVMIFVPVSDRYVLFSVEGEDLFSYKVIHVTGNAKLIELPIEERHVPNVYLSALMISDANAYLDTKQVVVPPVERFLAVALKADREQYQPREEGTLSIATKDAAGRPVSAEVALGLVDESVQYIQQDYAGDPRQFYYGRKRAHLVQTQSTFNQKNYARLVEVEEGQLRDRKDIGEKGKNEAGAGPPLAYFIGGSPDRSAMKAAVMDSVTVAQNAELPPQGTLRILADLSPTKPEQEPVVQVRSDFRSTILWLPDVKTDADGTATVKVKYPDSLTTWTATARVATTGNQFGIGNTSTRTKQPLIVRLQAPRFFVVGDQVTVSAVINNNTDQPMSVAPALTAEGLTVAGLIVDDKPVNDSRSPVEVKANSETRVDWLVAVNHASQAKLKVEARGRNYVDAMEKTFTIFEHGIEKFVSKSGKMRGDSVSVKLDIPKERRTDSTSLTVQIGPSMATTMLDALPYLIDYPYGCTEQTMSRFLPAVITAKTLRDLGLKPETAMNKIFGGIEESSAAATHPKGRHDLKELEAITNQSLERLYDFQHADGGWGWWKEGDSDHFMTAYVVWGMSLARQAGVEVKAETIERAVAYLDKELVEEETNYDQQAWILHALSVYHAMRKQADVGKFQQTAFTNLWTNRDKLNAYTRALLALAAHNYGYNSQAQTLIANLENGVKYDSHPDTSIVQRGVSDPSVIGTAHWGEDGIYWRWSDGGVEATAFALRALLAIDPQNKLIEPVTNWLVKNRRGAQWSNTRDTAIVVLTLNDYLRTSGELQPSLGYKLIVNGTPVTTKQITAEDALSAPSKFAISRELIRDGENEISIVRSSGTGPIYFSVAAQFFSLEEPLKPAGNEIFVQRQYFKLVNHPTLLKGYVSERIPLNDGETVKSGDRVEVVLTIEAKNNYEYLLFEDLKPAGLEAVQIRSGDNLYIRELKSGGGFTDRTRRVYQELRDRKVALFIDHLPEGVWELRYEMRAEAPGAFHALPVLGHAMYVPEIRTNGAETRVRVVD